MKAWRVGVLEWGLPAEVAKLPGSSNWREGLTLQAQRQGNVHRGIDSPTPCSGSGLGFDVGRLHPPVPIAVEL